MGLLTLIWNFLKAETSEGKSELWSEEIFFDLPQLYVQDPRPEFPEIFQENQHFIERTSKVTLFRF